MTSGINKAAVSSSKRVAWVDDMKLFACVLVVLGHFYMSLQASGWIAADASYYCLPIQTVYTFHVALFFVCSGFLYQRKRTGYTLHSHLATVLKKLIDLGVPYVVFSSMTLVLKMVFSDAVNHQATPFVQTLLFEPIAPYWYLYTLFLLFLLIPRISSRKHLALLFAGCFLLKVAYVAVPLPFKVPDALGKIASNAVWFAFGMLLSDEGYRQRLLKRVPAVISLVFAVAMSLVFYRVTNQSSLVQFVIAAPFVYSLTYLFTHCSRAVEEGHASSGERFSRYFLPVYVLHTITAAGMRTLLLKLCIVALPVHVVAGLFASFLIPMAAYAIASSYWWLLFWFEPSHALKMRSEAFHD